MRRLQNFFRSSGARRRLLIEASLTVLWVRLCLRLLPFRWIAPSFGRQGGAHQPQVQPHALACIQQVQDAIAAVVRNVPGQTVCLPQAIAAQRMLRRRGVQGTLYLGTRRENGELHFHAWLKYAHLFVTGAFPEGQFKVLTSFAAE